MSQFSEVSEILKNIYKTYPFSMGLHTTSKSKAENIAKEGLNEYCGRTLAGTVKVFGDLKKDVELGDFNWFFPKTDATVIVGIPACFGAKREMENASDGGNLHTNDFSLFLEFAKAGLIKNPEGVDEKSFKSAKELFNNDGIGFKIPSELILGYYDKEGNITFNENCEFLKPNSQFLKNLELMFKHNESLLTTRKTFFPQDINYGEFAKKPNSLE